MNEYLLKWSDGLVIEVGPCTYKVQGGQQLEDFGCANGMPNSWFDKFDGKVRYSHTVGRCLTRYFYPDVGITYTIDTSD